MNRAAAMKNYGATKLVEVCRACGVCEPGAFDGSDTQKGNGKSRDSEEKLKQVYQQRKCVLFYKKLQLSDVLLNSKRPDSGMSTDHDVYLGDREGQITPGYGYTDERFRDNLQFL
jgi:hypothetical protein